MKARLQIIGLLITLLGFIQSGLSQSDTLSPVEINELPVIFQTSGILNSLEYIRTRRSNQIPLTKVGTTIFETLDQAILGKSSGLFGTLVSGQPLGQTSIHIRGINTLAGGSEPLYVLDGFPLYNDNLGSSLGFSFGPPINQLSFLNPGDIESIELLKSIEALAMYGARGANGVLVIHTKQGNLNNSGIEYSNYLGLQQPINKYDILNASQFSDYQDEALSNAGFPIRNSSIQTNTNWLDEILHQSPIIQNHQLAFSRKNDNASIRISTNYRSKQGLIEGSGYKKFSINAKVISKISERLTINNMFNTSFLKSDGITTDDDAKNSYGLINSAHLFNPLIPVYNSSGNLNILNNQVGPDGTILSLKQSPLNIINPKAQILAAKSELSNIRIVDYFNLDYSIFKTLSLQFSAGIDALFGEEYSFANGILDPNATLGGLGRAGQIQYYNWVSKFALNYRKELGGDQRIQMLIGVGTQKYQEERLSGISEGFENQSLGFFSLGVGQNKDIFSFYNEWSMQSAFAHLTYDRQQKYFINISLRSDASSRFGGVHTLFPAIGVEWKISEEAFLVNNKFDLSLRAGYGISGNQEISPYSRLGILQQVVAPLGNTVVTGFRPSNIMNEDLEVEKTNQLNLGADLVLLSDRVSISVDAYFKNTNNALIFLPQPGNSGLPPILSNGAEITNSGLDINVISKNSIQKLKWETLVNLSFLNNKVKSLPGNIDLLGGSKLLGIDEWTIAREGTSIGSYFGYISDGIVQNGETNIPSFSGEVLTPGDRKYRDLNNDGIINRLDKSIIGNPIPKVHLGVLNKFEYQGFDLSIFVNGKFGNDIANFNKFTLESLDGKTNNTLEAYQNRWTSANPSNVYPRLDYSSRVLVFSDVQVENGSFVRIQNVTFGYSFSDSVTKKIGGNKLRLFINLQNIWTWTQYGGLDPEVNHFGQSVLEQSVDFGGYPGAKIFLAGLNLSF